MQQDLPRMGECVACMSNPRTICWRKCGHIAACEHCALEMHCCPFCREPGETMRVFVPE